MKTSKVRIVDGVRRFIEACPYCGATDVQAEEDHRRCIKCADRLRRYREAKMAYHNDPSPENTDALLTVIYEYKRLSALGYRVPSAVAADVTVVR